MQENNVIYEIAQQIQDKQVIENDMKEAFTLVTNLFKTKYIDKINLELKNNIDNIKSNPPKEIVLLNAIKPFMLEENHKNIDDAINLVTNISALNYMIPKNIENKIHPSPIINVNALNNDPSVKEDGVYDIDENCMFSINNSFNSNNLLILIFMLLLFKL